ncbi:MAG: hypothetical protein Q9181_006278 [Wetmoreana brouardii]
MTRGAPSQSYHVPVYQPRAIYGPQHHEPPADWSSYGNVAALPSMNPQAPYTGHGHVSEYTYPETPGCHQSHTTNLPQTPLQENASQRPQGPVSSNGKTKGSPPKHLTCWFWYYEGRCRHSGAGCLYSHEYLGPNMVADRPVQRERGRPSVAGRNARKENPDYVNWQKTHGTSQTSPYKEISSRVREQIDTIHARHKTSPEAVEQELEHREAEQLAHDALVQAQQNVGNQDNELDITQLLNKQSEVDTKNYNKRSYSEEPAISTMEFTTLSASYSQPSKSMKLDSNDSSPTIDPEEPSADTDAENQTLRNAVQDLSRVALELVKSSAALRSRADDHSDDLIREAFKIKKFLELSDSARDSLLRPIAGCTEAFTAGSMDAEKKAKESIDEIREKLLGIGQGGLLIAWDRDICSSTTESG